MNVAVRLIGFLSLCFLLVADQIEISSCEESQQEPQSSTNVIRRTDVRTSALHFFKESIHELSSREDLAVRGRARQDYLHDVVFVIQQRNMDVLTRILDDISNPLSPNYGHHLSNRKIADMTSNVEGRDAVIEQLDALRAVVISETLHGDYITARAPISVWEKMFDTQFYRFHQMQHTGAIDELVRAKEYSIPVELRDHVESVFNTIQMPLIVHGHLPVPHLMDIPEGTNIHTDAYSLPGFTTPAKIKAYYNIGTTVGSASSTQGVFSTIGQYFSPADLSYFQKYMGLPNQPVANSLGGYSSDTECVKDTSVCSEGNLDVQYIMAVSPESPTTYWYTNLIFSDWMVSVANTANPPLIFSISYGSEESTLSKSELTAFNTQIIKLSAQGITFFAAAGDDGALSRYVRTKGSSSCGYAPLFPASNPYVVSVGATSGLDSDTTEVVCQADITSAITSGGGFSIFYPQPSYQTDAINAYFQAANDAGTTPNIGYNAKGRGYPDIALAGLNYAVVLGQSFYKISGTSASAPAVAGMFSSINAARMALGKGPVGFIHPALYMNSDSYVNDITSGDNHCAATGRCCQQGFWAGPGWDPITGLGSLNYKKLEAVFVKLGTVNSANREPTARPSLRPTLPPTGRPTSASKAPMAKRGDSPSNTPTAMPSGPTRNPVPSLSPTSSPSVYSSAKPTFNPTEFPTDQVQSAGTSGGPSYSTITTFEAYQTATGLTIEDAEVPSFGKALQKTVSSILGVSMTAVSGARFETNRRRLLSNSVGVYYTVSVNSGISSDGLITLLQKAVADGRFLASLKTNSGVSITGISSLIILGFTPTTSPSKAPVSTSLLGADVTTVKYVGGAVGGLVLFLIIVCILTCCCTKKKTLQPVGSEQSEYEEYDYGYEPAVSSSRPSSNHVSRGPTPPHSRPASNPRPARNQDMGEDKDKDRPISSSRGSRGPTPPHSRPSSGTHSKKSQDVKEDKDKDKERPVTPLKSRPPSGPRPARDVTVNSGRDSDKDRDRDGLTSVPRPRLHSDKTNSSRSICETDPPPPATERITSTPIRPPAIDPLALPTDDIPSLSPHVVTRKPSVARMGTPVAKKN